MTSTSIQRSAGIAASQPSGMAGVDNGFKPGRLHYFGKFAQTILITPFTSTIHLACRTVKLITWDVSKAVVLTILGHRSDAGAFLEDKYLRTARVARDILSIPITARSALKDLFAKREEVIDDLPLKFPQQSYLTVEHTQKFDPFSSFMHGYKSFNVVQPNGIQAFAAESDGDLQTVMASHFLKPNVIAINFGLPNVATFVTEPKEDGSVQTVKVDAKSLKRAPMTYHPTNGKIQSGVFLVPTNLPDEALARFKAAAEKLQGRSDVTCVNTNCRVLKEAGFSIEGTEMEDVVLPMAMMEHFFFRNVFYTDSAGKKHKVHFDVVNTTGESLEQHFENIDLAVVGTRLRHNRRNADTDESRTIRGVAAKALIAQEKERLEALSPADKDAFDLTRRKVTVSVPSAFGDVISRIWGRHTIYEMDLSDKKALISQAFESQKLAKLRPFPKKNPSFVTRLKRDLFFSQPMINFLRRHIMGYADTLYLNTQDLFAHLKSTDGEHLNYVILEDKVIVARVKANGEAKDAHRKAADWALSKHALLAGRKDVLCSGEMWYDQNKQRFVLNSDSGTYTPSDEHVKVSVALANQIFATTFGNAFEFVQTEHETEHKKEK